MNKTIKAVNKFKHPLEDIYNITNNLIIEIKKEETKAHKKDFLIGELIEVSKDLVKNNCYKYLYKHNVTELSYEDLYEIATSFALVEAIQKYDSSLEVHFLYFWHLIMKRMFNKAFMHKLTQKEKLNDACYELKETDSQKDFSEEYCEKKSLHKYIIEFEKEDKYGQLIKCELIQNKLERKKARLYVLGAVEYGAKERKIVQRTKERFKKFLLDRGFEN